MKSVALILIAFVFIGGAKYQPGIKTPAKPTDFAWGINGHPLTQSAYRGNLDEQVKYLKDLKLGYYRFDVLLNAEGYPKNEEAFTNLLKTLAANKIKPLPVLMQSGFKGLDDTAIYKLSYLQGKNFTERYRQYLSVIEVNNEADNKIMLPGDPSGRTQKDYNLPKSAKVISAIKGFVDGLKATDNSVKVTLSVSYIHYYYLQLLADNKVNYDIIGCHWYSNMGDIESAKPFGDDVLARVTERFKKPIWLTEFNYGKGTSKVGFEIQNNYITGTINKMLSRNIISGLFIYELFDQPALKSQYPNEANYGLIARDNNGYDPKDAYRGFKQVVQQSK